MARGSPKRKEQVLAGTAFSNGSVRGVTASYLT